MGCKIQILFLVLLPFQSSAQIGGRIFSAESGEGIPFATVRWSSSQGSYTDAEGRFSLPDSLMGKDLIVSCVGFSTDTVTIRQDLKLELKPSIQELTPVIISDGKLKSKRIGAPKKDRISTLGVLQGFQVGMHIQNDGRPALIQKAFFNVRGGHSGSEATKPTNSFFRVRIYAVDEQGKPGEDLLQKNLVVYPKQNKGWVEVDLSAFYLTIPKEGIFVAMEWLDNSPTAEYEVEADGVKTKRHDFGHTITIHRIDEDQANFWTYRPEIGWRTWGNLSALAQHLKATAPGIALEVIEF